MKQGNEECALCDKVLAGVGIIIGLVFLYIAFDVLSNSRITTALTRSGEEDE